MNWNPHATATLGLEWVPTASGLYALDSQLKMVATSFDQSTSQIIGAVEVANAGLPTRGGLYVVEVYDGENGIPVDSVASHIAVPNEDVSIGSWLNQAGSGSNLYQSIDEGSSTDRTDYIVKSGGVSTYNGRLNTGSFFSLTGQRILAVKLNVYVGIGPTGLLNYGLNIGGSNYAGSGSITSPGTFNFAKTWYYNPATDKPWTIADVQAFDTTDEFYVQAATTAGVWAAVAVYAVWMTVYTVTENRIAVGTLSDVASGLTAGTVAAPAWNSASMLTPTGGAWTKDGSGRHLYTVRRINSAGSMNVPYLDAGVAAPIGQSWDATLDSTFGYMTAQTAQTRLYPFVQRTTAPADSVDSQPFCAQVSALVYTGRNAESEFDGAAALAYGVLRVALNADVAGADLTVKIKRRSDNVQLGGTLTVTAAQVQALGSGWQILQVQLPATATLAAATQYYAEFSSAAASSAGWQVLALTASGAGQTATYGGTTDAATINGAGENTSIDVAMTISTVPTAPAALTAAAGSLLMSGETICCVDSIARADLTWSVTALGGSFLRYEIQRSTDGGFSWVDIATVTVEAVAAWEDYEGPRGVVTAYRIRVVRTDLAFSSWTTSGNITKTVGDNSMHAVSNYDPSFCFAFDYRPSKGYTHGEADDQVLMPVYGRDYQLGFNPLENRGSVARYDAIVGVDDKIPIGGGAGWRAFDVLRGLARAPLPYVCLLDANGNQMFAQLKVPSGTEEQAGARYIAPITASEITATPYVVEVTS